MRLVPARRAAPASARNSRWRVKQNHDGAGENAEHDLGDDRDHVVADPVAALGLEDDAIDEVADHPGEEDHEDVDHTLDEGEGDHVAVGDVAHLVGEHAVDLVLGHAAEQPGADGDQRAVATRAGGEGVRLRGVVDRHLGHRNSRGLGVLSDGLHQPQLHLGAGIPDHLGTGGALGHPLGQGEGDEGSTHPVDRGEDQERPEIQIDPLLVEKAVDPEELEDDAQHHEDGDVGGEEESDAFHQSTPGEVETPEAGRSSPSQPPPMM